jgi:hypothetical protein
MAKTSNSACRRYVEKCLPFLGSNLSAVWISQRYIVYSYGPHWPLFIYEQVTDTWYANRDKRSQSTSRHYSQANPSTYAPQIKLVPLSTRDMAVVADAGSVGLIEAANARLETV